jgi:ribulose-5-phosphate 4-epimerase/fuculose-1-phosphate aldolase
MAVALKERRETVNPAVTEARIDLAAALRMAARLGLSEGVCNHFSLAVPGTSDRFLINPDRIHWSELRASDMLMVDPDGNLIEGSRPPEPTAFFIHSRIHRANPRAACVLHTHMPHATALTALSGGRIEWVSQTSLKFWNDVGYDDEYNGLVLDDREGDRICAALGDKRVLFLANHGAIVVGRTVAEAFDDLYYLERACQLQVLAMHTGRPLRHIPREICQATNAQMNAEKSVAANAHFTALKRLLETDGPDFRQ